MPAVEKIVTSIARWLNWIAAFAIVAVMTIVCINVLARIIFETPLKGTVDIVSQLGVIIIACAVAYTQVLKGHIRITVFIDKLPELPRFIIACLVDMIGIILFGIMSWQTSIFTRQTFKIGELSEVLKIPLTPFAAVISFSCVTLTLVLFIDLINVISKRIKK